jgi:hypothetical protein
MFMNKMMTDKMDLKKQLDELFQTHFGHYTPGQRLHFDIQRFRVGLENTLGLGAPAEAIVPAAEQPN